MALDRGTRIYATVLVALALAALFAIFYQNPQVAKLNALLEQDQQLRDFPYRFRVLRVEKDGVAIMSTPRSSNVPVARMLDRIFPGVGNSDPSSPLFQEMQKQLASTQDYARKRVLSDPDIHSVRWEIDRDWLAQQGLTTP